MSNMATTLGTKSPGRQTVTAFFDDRAEADRAVERIRAEGVSSADIRVVEGANTAATTGTDDTTRENKGFWESLGDLFLPDDDRYTYAEGLRRGGYLVTVTTADVNHERILDILDDEGTVDMEARESSWRSEGWSGYQTGSEGYAAGTSYGARDPLTATDDTTYAARSTLDADEGLAAGAGYADTSRTTSASTATATRTAAFGNEAGSGLDAERDGTINVVEEQLRVGKRDVSHGRVRVRSYVVSEPVSEDVSLRSERVEIERRPVDRAVGAADTAFQDRTLELEETAEEAVISKEARVKEEINLNRRSDERTETVSDSIRRTEVEIEDERTGQTIDRTGTRGDQNR